jgi:hypothetical protein
VIGGGKFANGAQTGAFRYLFNDDMHYGRTFSNSRKFKTQHNVAILMDKDTTDPNKRK